MFDNLDCYKIRSRPISNEDVEEVNLGTNVAPKMIYLDKKFKLVERCSVGKCTPSHFHTMFASP